MGCPFVSLQRWAPHISQRPLITCKQTEGLFKDAAVPTTCESFWWEMGDGSKMKWLRVCKVVCKDFTCLYSSSACGLHSLALQCVAAGLWTFGCVSILWLLSIMLCHTQGSISVNPAAWHDHSQVHPAQCVWGVPCALLRFAFSWPGSAGPPGYRLGSSRRLFYFFFYSHWSSYNYTSRAFKPASSRSFLICVYGGKFALALKT